MDIPLVGRATTAAPGYFRHLTTRIGGMIRFKDGGFGCNNPSWEIYKDIKALLANGSKDMGPFISIGTGVSDVHLFPVKQGHLRHRLAELSAVTGDYQLGRRALTMQCYMLRIPTTKNFNTRVLTVEPLAPPDGRMDAK